MHSISMPDKSDVLLSVRDLFGIDTSLQVKGFQKAVIMCQTSIRPIILMPR
jgi:hypothetical protein